MNKYLRYTLGTGLALMALTTISCSDQDDEILKVDYERIFAPYGLEAKVVNSIDARISWNPTEGASEYSMEIFQDDSLSFEGSPVLTFTDLTIEDVPFVVKGLLGDTKYSARIKAFGESKPESKWNGVYFRTDPEKLLNEVDEDDLTYSSVVLSWKANKTVTGVVINNKTYSFTAEDLAACTKTIEGLEGNTKYTARLVNGEKNCGERTFTTLIDPATAIYVEPDGLTLSDAIAQATEGNNLILVAPGEYSISKLEIVNDVQIVGERTKNRPVIKGGNIQFKGGTITEMRNIILDGNGSNNHAFDYKEVAENGYGALKVENCYIKNFVKGLFYLNVATQVESITFDNNIIEKVECSGSDFMDSRKGAFKLLTFTNNTVFNSCAERDFVRYDNTAKTFPDITTEINVSNNTLVGVANNASRRLMYVRFSIVEKDGDTVTKLEYKHNITFKNNLVTNTVGYFAKNLETNIKPTCSNNNYFAAANAGTITAMLNEEQLDFKDSSAKTLDPKFKDAENGDFTITNEDVVANKVGDPRWLN